MSRKNNRAAGSAGASSARISGAASLSEDARVTASPVRPDEVVASSSTEAGRTRTAHQAELDDPRRVEQFDSGLWKGLTIRDLRKWVSDHLEGLTPGQAAEVAEHLQGADSLRSFLPATTDPAPQRTSPVVPVVAPLDYLASMTWVDSDLFLHTTTGGKADAVRAKKHFQSHILTWRLMNGALLSKAVAFDNSDYTRSVVDVWIAVLRRAFNDNVGWAVPLERLVWKSPIISVQFDGSPDGEGAVVPAIDECGHRVEAWAALEFDCGMTSSHQNASEYIAATFGVALLVSLGYRNCGVRFVGDSRTVLNWIGKQSARSELALRAAVLCGALMRAAGLVVSEAWWLSSADNSIPDDISRRKYGHAVLREVSRNPWSQSWEDRAWALINPTVDQNFDSFDWLAVLQEADDLAGELVNAT